MNEAREQEIKRYNIKTFMNLSSRKPLVVVKFDLKWLYFEIVNPKIAEGGGSI